MGENWHSERSASEDHVVFDARGAEICTVPRDVNHSAQIAHLIASAPDLKAENERLRAALERLSRNVRGLMVLETELRGIAGNTNVNALQEVLSAARNALGEKSDS